MNHLRILLSSTLLLIALAAHAQGVAVYGKDGSRVDYLQANIDSLVFFEVDPQPLDVPESVETVDLGLSVKWASCNVGAQQPHESGARFAWGEVEEKSIYDWSTYFDPECQLVNGSIAGTGYDVASKVWGGSWRLPSLAEMQELCDNCTWTWAEQNGQAGCLVTATNGASIFLPAAGILQGQKLFLDGAYGAYATGQIDAGNAYYARSLVFYADQQHWIETNLRDYGQSVRPVMP